MSTYFWNFSIIIFVKQWWMWNMRLMVTNPRPRINDKLCMWYCKAHRRRNPQSKQVNLSLKMGLLCLLCQSPRYPPPRQTNLYQWSLGDSSSNGLWSRIKHSCNFLQRILQHQELHWRWIPKPDSLWSRRLCRLPCSLRVPLCLYYNCQRR